MNILTQTFDSILLFRSAPPNEIFYNVALYNIDIIEKNFEY